MMPNVGDEIFKLRDEARLLKERLANLSYLIGSGTRYMSLHAVQTLWVNKRLAVIEVQLTLLGVKV